MAADKEILDKLECPFTWNMEAIANYDRAEKQYHENDDEDFLPLLKLMRKIMAVYVAMHANEDGKKIFEILDRCKEDVEELEKSSNTQLSVKVVKYIWQATQCFVYKKFKMTKELEKELAELKDVRFTSKMEQGTLVACRSICWSKYHRIGSYEAEKFIREAIEKNPKCDIFYFILAKNLRRQRRDISIVTKPSGEEVENFLKAYNMSKNPVYELFIAQMYREMRQTEKARQIYEKIYKGRPESTTILLRLALGFIRLRQFEEAKDCLDQVEKKIPNHSMFLHYSGTYYMKLRSYRQAIYYFKKAMEDYNISAEKEFLVCSLKVNRNFAIIEHLLSMLAKYNDLPENQLQSIYLDLGFCFWLKKNNLDEALDYFLRAIAIDPEAKCITHYFDYINFGIKNGYREIAQRFLPKILNKKSAFDQETLNKAEKLKQQCDKSYSNSTRFRSMENAFGRMKM